MNPDYSSLLSFFEAAPCGLIELEWNQDKQDFKVNRSNKVSNQIINSTGGPVDATGLWISEAVPGHKLPIKSESGLSTLEIYYRVAFHQPPYENGERDAVLEFTSPKLNLTKYFKQRVVRLRKGVIAIGFIEITQQKELEAELKELAYQDPLTGAYSRRFAEDQVQNAISVWKTKNIPVSLLLLDLDKFKPINDQFGHDVGDWVLCHVVHRIQDEVNDSDYVCRLGGDEFLIILWGCLEQQAYSIAQKIKTSIAFPYFYQGTKISLSASIGVRQIFTDDNKKLFREVDQAMYVAKKERHGNCVVVGNNRVQARWKLEQCIRQAIQKKEFILYYQPIINLQTNKIDGCEALCRWHRESIIIGPNDFIPLAEESGILHDICWQVLEIAFQQSHAWRDKEFWMAVNLAGSTLMRPDFWDHVTQLSDKYSARPEYLEFEITENEALPIEFADHSDLSQSFLGLLGTIRKSGYKLAIDDFGTGFSGFARFDTFARSSIITKIKIDKILIDHVTENPAICKAIINLALEFNLDIVCEGIETQEQATILRDLGATYGQGFLWSKPVPANKFEMLSIEQSLSLR